MEKRKLILIILVVLGIVVSGYLTYYKLAQGSGQDAFSCNLGQCDIVQQSKYSELFGIPVALFGVGFYVLLGSLILSDKGKLAQLWGIWGLLFSSYLTVVELFVIEALCGWCVISFVIIILINLFLSAGTPETAQNDLPSS